VLGLRGIVALGCASLALGALTPWVMTGQDPTQDSALLIQRAVPPEPGPPLAAAAAAPRQGVQGVIAVGDEAMTDARECLSERGVTVYPRTMSSADDLLTVLADAAGDHAAVFIHVGTESGIVDGQILKALDLLGPSQRIVWATIQIPDPEWGGFSFEERTNASIRNVVGRQAEGRVLDWNVSTASHPEWTLDGVRLSPEGCREYARKVIKLSGLPRGT
jgi:hypothetical protein